MDLPTEIILKVLRMGLRLERYGGSKPSLGARPRKEPPDSEILYWA